MNEYEKVERDTFAAYRDALPRHTRCHIVRICEPPEMWFSLEGVKMAFIEMMDGSAYYQGKTDEYYILSSKS